MAAGTLCKLRRIPDTDRIAQQIVEEHHISQKFSPYEYSIFTLTYAGASSNGKTEISPPDTVFDGTTTVAYVYAISSSAQDTSTGTGVRTIILLGLDENDVLKAESITMTGATQVKSSNKYKRIFHHYATSWGSGNDAAGDITISDDGQSNTYLTIGAGSNESDGSAIWVPEGSYCRIVDKYGIMTTHGNAANAVLITVDHNEFDGNGSDPDLDKCVCRLSHGKPSECKPSLFKKSDADGKITFSEQYITATEDFHIKYIIIVVIPT